MKKLFSGLLLLWAAVALGQTSIPTGIVLDAGSSIAGGAGTGSAITYTVNGVEQQASQQIVKQLARGQLPASAGTLYSPPAGYKALISSVLLNNPTGSTVSGVSIYTGGTAATNQIFGPVSIPSHGNCDWKANGGWQCTDGSGAIQTASSGGTSYTASSGLKQVGSDFRIDNPLATSYGGLGADLSGAGSGRYPKANGSGSFATSTLAASGTGSCTNQFVTALSADAAPTCTPATLASAQFANQGTATTLLHGNAAGNPTFGAVVDADLSGQIGLAHGGTNANLSSTGGTSQVLKQVSSGAAVTVGQLACADLSNAANSCSTAANTASSASTIVQRDANQNAFAANFIGAMSSTPAAAGTTVLTVASNRLQLLTGTGSQTFRLPDATTLTTGTVYDFNNNATGLLSIVENGSNGVLSMPPGSKSRVLLLTNGTANGSWDFHSLIPQTTTWGSAGLTILNSAAPSTPSTSNVITWTDSTDKRWHDRNDAGSIGTTVVADAGASNNFLTAVSSAGVISKARPTCANLSDSGSGCSATVSGTNTGDVTLTSSGTSANANGASLVGQQLQLQQASTSFAGLLSAADKIKLNGAYKDAVTDCGLNNSGGANSDATWQACYDSFPSTGGRLYFPAGTYDLSLGTASTITVTRPVLSIGAGRTISAIQISHATKTAFTSGTGSQGMGFEQMRFTAPLSTTRTAGYAWDMAAIANTYFQQADCIYQWTCIHSGGALQFVDDANIREFGANAANGQAILVNVTGGASAAGTANGLQVVDAYVYVVAVGPSATMTAAVSGRSKAASYVGPSTDAAETLGNVPTTATFYITFAGTASAGTYTVRSVRMRQL